jgi:hypothetical protein
MKLLWAAVSAGAIPVLIFAFKWFLFKTDILVGYGWKWEGSNFHPSFDVRNRSGSKTYFLGNVAYTKNNGLEMVIVASRVFNTNPDAGRDGFAVTSYC